MNDNDSKGLSYSAGFFMLFAFVVVGIYVASALSISVWTVFTGRSVQEMQKGLTNPAFGNVAKAIQAITAVSSFFLPTLLVAFLLNKRPIKLLGYSTKIKGNQIGLTVAILIAALFVSSSLSYFNNIIPLPSDWRTTFDKWESSYNDEITAIVGLQSPGEFIIALIIIGFLQALCEETFFRGGLQNFMTRSTHRPFFSIIVVSLIFSAFHISWYGFFSRFFLGVILGLIYEYSGSIWLCIIAHFLNNALAITALYVNQLQGKPLKDTITDHGDTLWGLIAIPVVIGLMTVFKRISYRSTTLSRQTY